MRIPRLYLPAPLAPEAVLPLGPEQAAYLRSVLRLPADAVLRVFDGSGREHEARLELAGRRAAVRIGVAVAPLPESPLRITLAQGIGRGERMDFVVQKATELGVSAIVPLLTARAVVRLDAARARRRHAHWQAVAASASEQCGRATVPEVALPVPFATWLARLRPEVGVLLDPAAATALAAVPVSGAATLLVGPEGGLDEDEHAAARAAGLVPARLGPRVLRTETAALVALSVLQMRAGDLG